ncbi:MAG: serine/threonine protein kinase [Ignavibacteria bacterium]|nr:serine/threonine protein kinase [Ignavibacteria bacterium]
MIDKIISNYKITDFIEEGGMGTIYKGSHIKLERAVAIKILHQNLTSNPQFKERFLNEAKILAKLSHPNIINIYDFIEQDGQYYIVAEFVEGKPLDKLISGNQINSIELALQLFRQILSGIGYAHSNGVVHRDIKPSNVMIQQDNTVKILDFGIAKLSDSSKSLTKTGTKMGSLYYMSPKQVLGQNLDSRTDIYSLGIVLFEMLTHRLPYNTQTESDYELMNSILSQELPDINNFISGLEPNIGSIIRKACAKDPNERFFSCEEFSKAIDNKSFNFRTNVTNFNTTRISSNDQQTDFSKTIISDPQFSNKANIKPKGSNTPLKISLILASIIIAIIFVIVLNSSSDETITADNQQEKIKSSSNSSNSSGKSQNTNEETEVPKTTINVENEVKSVFVKWINCWQNRDIDCFRECISSNYLFRSSTGIDKEQDYYQRINKLSKQFSERAYIRITYSDLSINMISNERVVLNYFQVYESDKYNDSGRKKVTFQKEGTKWKVYLDEFYN